MCAIISAAIPAQNRRLRLFNTFMGSSMWQRTVSHIYGKSGHSASQEQSDIPWSSVNTSNNRSRARSLGTDEITASDGAARSRPDQSGYVYTSSWVLWGEADAGSGRSQNSTDSNARITRKETHWHVSYDRSDG